MTVKFFLCFSLSRQCMLSKYYKLSKSYHASGIFEAHESGARGTCTLFTLKSLKKTKLSAHIGFTCVSGTQRVSLRATTAHHLKPHAIDIL